MLGNSSVAARRTHSAVRALSQVRMPTRAFADDAAAKAKADTDTASEAEPVENNDGNGDAAADSETEQPDPLATMEKLNQLFA